MRKLTRFFATCLLVASISGVTFADGGATQGPPAPVPPPSGEGASEYSDTELSGSAHSAQDASINIVTEATTMLATWLEAALF